MNAWLRGGACAVLAIAVAMLPRRYWGRFEPALPVSQMAFAAGLLTFFAGAALGISGFLDHLVETASLNNDAYMAAAIRWPDETLPRSFTLSILSVFTFALLTPQGWMSTYLTSSGVVRAAGPYFDDPRGDLILTAVDSGVRRVASATAQRAEIDNRHLLEGPAVPDRIGHPRQFGLPPADVAIVSSRLKAGWDPGVVVITDRGPFRILRVDDRMVGGKLRRIYSLHSHADLEVFRRTVTYELPS